MIAVGTSAIVAIVFGEPERAAFCRAILRARTALISTASVLEVKVVAYGRRGPRAVVLMDDLFRLPMFEITAPGPADLETAFGAFVAFGKGSGHPAALNFGDLFAYGWRRCGTSRCCSRAATSPKPTSRRRTSILVEVRINQRQAVRLCRAATLVRISSQPSGDTARRHAPRRSRSPETRTPVRQTPETDRYRRGRRPRRRVPGTDAARRRRTSDAGHR
jgi:ribonuclease VapC